MVTSRRDDGVALSGPTRRDERWHPSAEEEDGEPFLANERLVREGYAVLATFPPDVKYVEAIRAAEQEARDEYAGLWEECGGADTPLGEEAGDGGRTVEVIIKRPEAGDEAEGARSRAPWRFAFGAHSAPDASGTLPPAPGVHNTL